MLIINDLAYRTPAEPVDYPTPFNTGCTQARAGGGVIPKYGGTADISGMTVSAGSLTTSSNGQVIENYLIPGAIVVDHDNVVLNNCIIDAGVYPSPLVGAGGSVDLAYPNFDEGSWVTLNDCTIIGGIGTRLRRASLNRCNIFWTDSDPVTSYGGVRMEDCLIHHAGVDNDGAPHADAMHISSTVGGLTPWSHAGSNWCDLFINCRWVNPMTGLGPNTGVDNPSLFSAGNDVVWSGLYDSPTGALAGDAGVFVDSPAGPIDWHNIMFDNCRFEWGNRQLRLSPNPDETVTNIRFRDCGVSHNTRYVLGAEGGGGGTFINPQASGFYWLDEGNAFVHWGSEIDQALETNPFTVDGAYGASIAGHAAGDPCDTAPLDYNNQINSL
tara:strand:- start:814 stop:1962 length:1149 start_codon:yes stop_codon:yes gene_type:complete